MSKLSITSTVRLNDGVEMPRFGFGSYESATGEETYQSVLNALRAGYRSIDTAEWYENEEDCGRAIRDFIKESGVKRADIFYTTKLMHNWGLEHTEKSIKRSLELAGLDYIDLYLIHGPYPDKIRLESWDGICNAVKAGKIHSAGVSNYGIRHLEELMAHTKAKDSVVKVPSVNQLDLHPFMQRREDVAWNQKHGISLMAWGPLARGLRFDNAKLKQVATKHRKSPAQVLLRWSLQKGYLPIPKSVTPSRVKQNADIFDFELTESDMAELDSLEEYLVTDWDPIGASETCQWLQTFVVGKGYVGFEEKK